ncbi:MAG: hypothetical protein U5N85_01735 [Arcicella sp.]|nr:hypothetical protein [Arcicella sp.]
MADQLTFSKDFWSSTYEVKDGSQVLVRTEKNSIWSYDSDVKIGDKNYFFDVKGIFSDSIEVFEKPAHNLIATVDMSNWRNKATIQLDEKVPFIFEKTDFFSSEWKIFKENEVLFHFKKDWFANEGTVDVFDNDTTLLAIGIFLISLFRQKAAAAAA